MLDYVTIATRPCQELYRSFRVPHLYKYIDSKGHFRLLDDGRFCRAVDYLTTNEH